MDRSHINEVRFGCEKEEKTKGKYGGGTLW